jgi:hypothetical protein
MRQMVKMKMKMVRILTSKIRVNRRRQVQCEVDVIVNRITRLGRVFIRNSDLLQ